jgi:predicted nucleic acid-binding protein
MIVLDVNLLIYSVNEDSRLHKKAQTWLEATLSGTETVGLASIVLLASLTLSTGLASFTSPCL